MSEKCKEENARCTANQTQLVCVFMGGPVGVQRTNLARFGRNEDFFLLTAFSSYSFCEKREMYSGCLRQTMSEHYPGSSTSLREGPIKINLKGTVVIHTVTIFWQGSLLNWVSSYYKLTLYCHWALSKNNVKNNNNKKKTMWTSVEDKM